MNDTLFHPVRGSDAKIQEAAIHEGYIYFATDTGKIYTDKDGVRVPLGGAGATLLYAYDTEVVDNLDDTYYLSMDKLEDPNVIPKENDLIINIDGKFYKVISIDNLNKRMRCKVIAVSGTGGGGGGTGPGPGPGESNITLTPIKAPALSYLYGKSSEISFSAEAKHDAAVVIKYEIYGADGNYSTYSEQIVSGGISTFDVGSKLYLGTNRIIVTAAGENSGSIQLSYSNRQVMRMELNKDIQFNAAKPIIFNKDIPETGDVQIQCRPIGPKNKTIKVYFDDELYETLTGINNNGETYVVTINSLVEGAHSIRLEMSAVFNGTVVTTDPIYYELAWSEKNSLNPVIWFGDFEHTIINYGVITIRYNVYDPLATANSSTPVTFLRNGQTILDLEVKPTADKFLVQTLTQYEVGSNEYNIKCRNASRNVIIIVEEDEHRNLEIIKETSMMLLSTEGRSNNESRATRDKWSYRNKGIDYPVKFSGFNWINNGWLVDKEGHSYLKLSNGASIDIPFKPITFNKADSHTIEIRFKVHGVKDYSTLIRNETYYLKAGTKERIPEAEVDKYSPDELEKNSSGYPIVIVEKIIDTKNVCASWLTKEGDTKPGFAIGTQEAYFYTGQALVNARYKEDRMITLSFVVDRLSHLVFIYLNGILTSAIQDTNAFIVNNSIINFNSEICDIDLYDVRIYESALNFEQIVHNFIAERKDPKLFDQNQLCSMDTQGIPLVDFNKLLEYNKMHPDDLSMPYMIIESADPKEDRLPYFKGNKRPVNVTFVNPVLDKLYLEDALTDSDPKKTQDAIYLERCPSFTAKGAELNVQGTSSQGYPKRNYKCKFKGAEPWQTYLKDKDGKLTIPTSIEKWHMDHPDCATNKFTWKIDYMESSGSYNSGLADLLGLAYNKHPMDFYNFNFTEPIKYRTTVYGFPVITFHKHADNSYEYIGTYNFNLDKGSNEFYGFEDEAEQPYVTNPDGSHPKIADVAECWELRNNQGTWTSFKYPDSAKKDHFGTLNNDGTMEVINHFEYRYNNQEDELDEAYDGVTGGTFATVGEINPFLRKKYKNLEALFDWLVSTDIDEASDTRLLPEPITYSDVQTRYRAKTVMVPNIDGTEGTHLVKKPIDEEGNVIESEDKKDWVAVPLTENWNGELIVANGPVTYLHDDSEYRLQKFIHEFDQHLNKPYCFVYWIITELLLLYDSRGKNCMLASWGPTEKSNGNYVWFPIFYDMDTQLGINNSGIPTWDYDTDASISKTFSTPSSVLWRNILLTFRTELETYYQDMRTGEKVTKKAFNLENVVNAYNRDPNLFSDSYAMKGVRPMIIFNAGEFVKYLNIMNPRYGYYDTLGNFQVSDAGWLYIIQGDRELSRELFLTNRFNYFDSWFRAGPYNAEVGTGGSSVKIRMNANNLASTSDKYIYGTKAEGFITTDEFPFNEFDAQPNFVITPFLKQYVTIGYDDLYVTPQKFDNKPLTIEAFESVKSAFASTLNNGSQLTYIPAAKYLSSFGDLSSKYISECNFSAAERCRELILGCDTPGYKNNLLTKDMGLNDSYFLPGGAENPSRKALLEKVVLTGLQSYGQAQEDLSGSDKLKEFRALNTRIPSVKFAVGAPLETVHLPGTTTALSLINTAPLTNIIETKLISNQEIMPNTGGPEYKGLYIEGITDYDLPEGDSILPDTPLFSVQIDGDFLKYKSYSFIDKLTKRKLRTESGILKLEMKDVRWSPYILVPENMEAPDPMVKYVKATDHYTFEPYEDKSNWKKDIQNRIIYEEDPELKKDVSLIRDLGLLDVYINDFDQTEKSHRFTSLLSNDLNPALPLITGDIYVDNEVPISEVAIKNVYNTLNHFPQLNIFVKNVKLAKSAKFIETDESGKENILGTQKIDPDISQITWFASPWDSNHLDTYINPSRIHYDFIGWKMTSPNTNIIITEDEWNTINFSDYSGVDTFVFEAAYRIHEYKVSFFNSFSDAPNIPFEIITIPYNTPLNKFPNEIPYRDDSGLANYEVYDFIGYGFDPESSVKVPDEYIVKKDINLYSLFVLADVRKIVHDDWFIYTRQNYSDRSYINTKKAQEINDIEGYFIKPKFALSGKITLPKEHTDPDTGITLPVLGVYLFGAQADQKYDDPSLCKLTHIFVQPGNKLYRIHGQAFSNMTTLKYFDFENAQIRSIGSYAFNHCPLEDGFLGTTVKQISLGAFYRTFAAETKNVLIPASVVEMEATAFMDLYLTNGTITIGTPDEPSRLDLAVPEGVNNHRKFVMYALRPVKGVTFYSLLYSSPADSIVEGGAQVQDCFEYCGTISVVKGG